jgi:hypothetical protein
MQDGAFFCNVDPLPAEHRLHPGANSGLLRELDEELHCFNGDPILRVVEIDAHSFDRKALAASRVIGKQLPEMQLVDLFVM